jgi:hypothetical protein
MAWLDLAIVVLALLAPLGCAGALSLGWRAFTLARDIEAQGAGLRGRIAALERSLALREWPPPPRPQPLPPLPEMRPVPLPPTTEGPAAPPGLPSLSAALFPVGAFPDDDEDESSARGRTIVAAVAPPGRGAPAGDTTCARCRRRPVYPGESVCLVCHNAPRPRG